MRWAVIVSAAIIAGWFVFDGIRALVLGDYVTPRSGEYAGQLGPCSKIVAAIGIQPRSTLMKLIPVCYGIEWWGMPWAALFSLWYLLFGTVAAIFQLTLLPVTGIKS